MTARPEEWRGRSGARPEQEARTCTAESSRGGGPRRPPPPPCPPRCRRARQPCCACVDRRTASPSSLPPTSPPFSFPLFPVKADARRRAPPWPSSLAFLARQRRIDKAVLILCPSRQRLPPFPSWPPPPSSSSSSASRQPLEQSRPAGQTRLPLSTILKSLATAAPPAPYAPLRTLHAELRPSASRETEIP